MTPLHRSPMGTIIVAACLQWGCPSSAPTAQAPAPVDQSTEKPVLAQEPETAPPTQANTPEPAPEPAAALQPVGTLPPPPPPQSPPTGQASPENQALARQLNTEGYRLYNDKHYSEAVPKFEAAAHADPGYALPPYNLACTLCLLRGGEGTCENDAYKDRILSQLEMSILIDPDRLERARTDSDLACVHDTLRYQKLMGYSVSDPEAIPHLLTHVSWYGPAPGAFGNMSGLTFKADGTIKLWLLEVDEEVKTLHYTGTWRHSGRRVEVTLDQPTSSGVKAFAGELTEAGLQTEGGLGPFRDIPSECSA